MYNFESELYKDEYILYQGQAKAGKGSKNIVGLLIIFCFAFVMQLIVVNSVNNGKGDFANGITFEVVILFLATVLFEIIAINGLIYNCFIKKKSVDGNCYCITNKRALKYERKKDKLICGYLENYDDIKIYSEKKNVGDLHMQMEKMNGTGKEIEDLKLAKEIIFNKDEENMPYIIFESVENPKELLTIVQTARDELMNNINNNM